MRTEPQCGLRNAAAALDQRRVGQHPAVQGAVVHVQAALQEQLLDVAVAERVAQVPGDRLDDQRRLEVPAPEVALDRRFSLAAMAFRIMGRLRAEAASSAGMPNEP